MVSGMGFGQSLEDIQAVLGAVVDVIPARFPRAACAVGGPLEVMEAVAAGIDLVHSAWPDILTKDGKALTMPVMGPGE
ncbi:unnamed protein product, partial [Discosporangium mesarthrocarpum]